jgi:lysophospholipase L1-like esterase
VVGLIALVALLDLGLGAAVDGVSGIDPEEAAQAGGGLAGQDVPAAAGEPWRVQLGAEINQVWAQKRYDPYLGWTMPDIEGKHVHVSDGVRRSWAPTPAGGDPVTVYFLGGSAMFGLYQRDEHTIPSEVARLAAADGIELRAVNYGRLAYVNWQEVLLLEQLVTRGSAPDLAVFYDGFNEILGQFQLGPHDEVTHLEAAEVDRRLGLGQRGGKRPEDEESLPGAARRAWADVSLVHRLGRAAGVLEEPVDDSQPAAPGGPLWPDQTERPGRRGKLAATIHGRGVDLGRRLASSYGFETAFFWQPFLYSKRMHPGEEQLRGWLGTDADAWGAADAAARARLDPAVADVSGALDGVRAPVMYDFVHTNELGAKVMARAIYERLRPTLRRLAAERSP